MGWGGIGHSNETNQNGIPHGSSPLLTHTRKQSRLLVLRMNPVGQSVGRSVGNAVKRPLPNLSKVNIIQHLHKDASKGNIGGLTLWNADRLFLTGNKASPLDINNESL